MDHITFVRHGNTNHNVENRAQGHLHNPLNETGLREAAAVAKRLSEEAWDVLVSSDLLRARQTAEIISEAIRLPIERFDIRLREKDRGQIVDTIEEERVAKWGPNWRELDLGEETDQSLRVRGMSVVSDMINQYPGKKILVVTHGYFLGQTLKELIRDESTGDHLRNTSVTTVVRNGKKWEYLLYDCVRHLESEKNTP
ncbi:histidine phosphatase family protein [Paenibacillus hamazuiensis]|uniref:histidine phosphatase family protein n=1 Tax=Paenibacillus hamazuiensis TaxID=2936508 RepID=UPI00200BDEBD|nr:histidine phosphatase family protein [Paenibacillus hamazuiensis]